MDSPPATTTPTKSINKGHSLAFEIDIFTSAGSANSKKSAGVKERLEQRRGTEDSTQSRPTHSLNSMLEKLEKAKELRLKNISEKKTRVHQKNAKVLETVEEHRTVFIGKIDKLRSELTEDLNTHAERRNANIKNRMLKAQKELERVKIVQANKAANGANKENVNENVTA